MINEGDALIAERPKSKNEALESNVIYCLVVHRLLMVSNRDV